MAMLKAYERDAERLYHHLFLPPKLPQHQDEDSSDLYLARVVRDVLQQLTNTAQSHSLAVNCALHTIKLIVAIHHQAGDVVDNTQLTQSLSALMEGHTISLHIGAQNAGVLITRQGDSLLFEVFELSARNADVMTTNGRLIRAIPGRAVGVSTSLLRESDFLTELSQTLATMSRQSVESMQPQTTKAGAQHVEIRDTCRPSIVTELFCGAMRSIGQAVPVNGIKKRTRDEVNWNQTLKPWRRAPLWYMIRVTLQLIIQRSNDGSTNLYKRIMLYIMSNVLELALSINRPIEVLFTMTAKITRRLTKLLKADKNFDRHDVIADHVYKVLERVNDHMSMKWVAVQAHGAHHMPLTDLLNINATEDCYVNLHKLDSSVANIHARSRRVSVNEFRPVSGVVKFHRDQTPCLEKLKQGDAAYAIPNLWAFEEWVDQDLQSWTEGKDAATICENIHHLISQYHRLASRLYNRNPEGMSMMLLVLFELWVACDSAATSAYPLMLDYDPAIWKDPLQSLLLPFKRQMIRLQKIESYLHDRKARSKYSSEVMFCIDRHDGFACRFHKSSREHQYLLEQIKARADHERAEKKAELAKLKDEYHRLNDLAAETDHSTETRVVDEWTGETEERHTYPCKACQLQSQRDELAISIFEEPLPDSLVEAQSVVFELMVPSTFSYWRDTRSFLLENILEGQIEEVNLDRHYILSENDPHLTKKYFRGSGSSRISLLSAVKPVVNTHYRGKAISNIGAQSICVKNGLRYKYFDIGSNGYLENYTFDHRISRDYVYQDVKPCLQDYLMRTAATPDGKTPNQIIATQDTCPPDMTFQEFTALATVPFGLRIQWINIAAELHMPAVDFRKVDTIFFFLQCIYQTGPSGDTVLRVAHALFAEPKFPALVVVCLQKAIQGMRENWGLIHALGLLVAIAARTLSLNESTALEVLAFLEDARRVSSDWTRSLRDKAHEIESNDDRKLVIAKSVESALLCLISFDVDQTYLASLLKSSENVALVVEMSIIIQEGQHTLQDDNVPARLLTWRVKRLLSRSYKLLALNHHGISAGIRKSWAGLPRNSLDWGQALDHIDDWVVGGDTAAGVIVHYNLLTGDLLVNGDRLNQPPKAYCQHRLFQGLFTNHMVEVMPTTEPGFKCSTKRTFFDFHVLLGMSGEELVVRASHNDVVWETVPDSVLRGQYPSHFSTKFVHWYNLSTGEVKLRDITSPWPIDTDSCWTLQRLHNTRKWFMEKGKLRLIGLKTHTATAISRLINPLAEEDTVHIHLKAKTQDLHVHLHAAKLTFFIKHGCAQLRSKEYPRFIISEDQSVGTLIGLRSKLVLQSYDGITLMLIPESSVSVKRANDHVFVDIEKTYIKKVHALEVDSLLGRLIAKDDVGCKIFLAHLHALTSSCLPDPLTRRTGTEQALKILGSKSLTSFDYLTDSDISTLEAIAHLAPGRQFYPRHLRCMQTTTWKSELSFLSQDDNFIPAVEHVLNTVHRHRSLFSLEPTTIVWASDKHSDQQLRRKGAMRASFLRTQDFGAEDHTDKFDSVYEQRDNQWSEQASNSFTIASIFSRPGAELCLKPSTCGYLWSVFTSKNEAAVQGCGGTSISKMVRYDASFLEPNHFKSILERFLAINAWLISSKNIHDHRLAVMMWLATLAYADDAEMSTLQVLALFTKALPSFKEIAIPSGQLFLIQEGRECRQGILEDVLGRYCCPFGECPESQILRGANERKSNYDHRRKSAWHQAKRRSISRVVNALTAQWPCESPRVPDADSEFKYVHISRAMPEIRQHFQRWHDNRRFSEYLASIENAVARLQQGKVGIAYFSECATSLGPSYLGYPTIDDLLSGVAPVLPKPPSPIGYAALGTAQNPPEYNALGGIIRNLQSAHDESSYEQSWISELQESQIALQNKAARVALKIDSGTRCHVTSSEHAWTSYVSQLDHIFRHAIDSIQPSRFVASTSHRCRISPAILLQQLARMRWPKLSCDWKQALVDYGLALSNLRRARRLVRCLNNEDDLIKELQNQGHMWDPMEYPEWLILEIESDLTIRDTQFQIAAQMLCPVTAQNSVMQMNMGEGKSTVIIPMLAVSIADDARLARVVVNRPQSRQMLHMLVAKLGGIINRQVYRLPFARSPRLSSGSIAVVREVLQECMRNGGVLLAQPEHILSFTHMSPESYILNKPSMGNALLEVQTFLDNHSRDIIDESDENFSVRLELIYTLGTEEPIEARPDRWRLMQEIFGIIRDLAPALHKLDPSAVEFSTGTPGSFCRLRVLSSDTMNILSQQISKHITRHGISGLQICRQALDIRAGFEQYVCKPDISQAEAERFEGTSFWTSQTQPLVLLLRGLLAGGILKFVLGHKRWRVNFGLAERQPPTQLAVPYSAKDHPALRSEFSHPDVAIALTSLSYYYGGLSDDDLFVAFNHLMESDQCDVEYQIWVTDAYELPEAFRQLQGVNLEDRSQCINLVFPAFRSAKSTVDYFLSNIVFPREMREFPQKLSASGWDIGKKKRYLTTGFSGTKDSKPTLPLDVEYLGLEEQKQTSALVLEYLLQETNSVTLMPRPTEGISDAEAVLDVILRLEYAVQVILDVGAQILELDNLAMAKRWLERDNQGKDAVVYVDHEDNICVVDRAGRIEALHASSFASSLATCLVFLDQSHTRGIDLRLPKEYRAAVMLGPRLEKDSLVQACMRMRKLGNGQSLEFCIPAEVQTSITEINQNCSGIGIAEIIYWSITETFKANRRNMPLWAVQGERFLRQKDTWEHGLTQENASMLLENEKQSIEDRYRPYLSSERRDSAAPHIDLTRISERCEQFGQINAGLSALQEEQERELAPEKEQEREVQRAPPMKPAQHSLHPDIETFAKHGILKTSSNAYMPAFESLKSISASPDYPRKQLAIKKDLWVSRDFATTVEQRRQDFKSDLFLRSVRWVMTSSSSTGNIETVMIISPFEANRLIADVRHLKARIHVYGPRNNLGYDPMDALDFYAVPSMEGPATLHLELAARLNAFAGQLYFSSYSHYVAYGRAFHLATEPLPNEMDDSNCEVDNDGFIRQPQDVNGSGLTKSPVQFLRGLALIRNGGRSIDRTHVGQCLTGMLLQRQKLDERALVE